MANDREQCYVQLPPFVRVGHFCPFSIKWKFLEVRNMGHYLHSLLHRAWLEVLHRARAQSPDITECSHWWLSTRAVVVLRPLMTSWPKGPQTATWAGPLVTHWRKPNNVPCLMKTLVSRLWHEAQGGDHEWLLKWPRVLSQSQLQ